MADNSSLYGSTPPTGTVSSSNYTTLYNGNGNYVPGGDNVIISGTLTVNGCAILTDCSTFSLLPANATTINFGGSATAMNIGANTGVTTILNQLATANYSFPVADGTANQVLITDGSGNLSFADIGSLDTNYTIQADTTTGGANLTLAGSDGTTDSVKFASGTNITVSRTDNSTITISGTDTNTTYTQNSSVTTGGANLNLVGSDATTDTVKFAEGAGISVVSTDANTITITNTSANTLYNIDASATTGGANFNLTGSDLTTDTIKFAEGTGMTIVRTDANTITFTNSAPDTNTTYTQNASTTTGGANLNLVGSDGSIDPVKFGGSGATTVTRTDANTITISSTDTNTTYTQNASATTGGANLNLVGSDGTTDAVKFANGTNITVAQVDASTISISTTGITPTDVQQVFAEVRNQQGSTITIGQVVYLFGATGNHPTVKLADNSGDSTSAKSLGLVYDASINNGAQGLVITQGLITGVNTAAFAEGDSLYLGSTPGSVTNVKPYAPEHLVYIGVVVKSNVSTGEIFVRVQNGYELGEIHDVDLITNPPTNNQVLTYVAATDLWTAQNTQNIFNQSLNTTDSPTFNALTLTNGLTLNNDQTGNAIVSAYGGTTLGTLTWDGANWISSNGFSAGVLRGGNITIGYLDDQKIGTLSGDLIIEPATGLLNLNAIVNISGDYLNLNSDDTANDAAIRFGNSSEIKYNRTDNRFELNKDVYTANNLLLDGGLFNIYGATSGYSSFSAPATGSNLSYILPGSAGAANTVLTNDGSGNLSWALPGGGGSTFGNISIGVVTDNTIGSTNTNGDIILQPNGNGDVNIAADTLFIGDGGASTFITTNGAGTLYVNTNNGTNTGSIFIEQGVNGNIVLEPYATGTGAVKTYNNFIVDEGVLFVDATNNKVGVNTTSPEYEFEIVDGGDGFVQFGLTNTEREFVITNNAGDDLVSISVRQPAGSGTYANRLQFDATSGNQWFASGNLGVANSAPAYTLDVGGDIKVGGDTIYNSFNEKLIDYTQYTDFQGTTSRQANFQATNNIGVRASFLVIDGRTEFNTTALTTSATTADQVLATYDPATADAVKAVIRVRSGTAVQCIEVLMVQNGTDISLNTYGDVRTGANLTTISSGYNIGTGFWELRVTPVNAVTTYTSTHQIMY